MNARLMKCNCWQWQLCCVSLNSWPDYIPQAFVHELFVDPRLPGGGAVWVGIEQDITVGA